MFGHLQIYDRRERLMVGVADIGLGAATALVRPLRRRPAVTPPPRRILLLRLERIGDLLMSAPAIRAIRGLAPDARLDLVVGSWNESIARMLGHTDHVETMDARWLSRGATAPGFPGLVGRARGWRKREYDLAINFEGDIRSHLLMAASGAPRRIGFDMAGGGPVLTDRVPYDPSRHVAENLMRLVDRAFGTPAATRAAADLVSGQPWLVVPASARQRANDLLQRVGRDDAPAAKPLEIRRRVRPIIGVHVSAGRQVKQWDPARFGDVAAELAVAHDAVLVFSGTEDDRPLVDAAVSRVPPGRVLNLCGEVDLPTLAALLERFWVFLTCDSGPMHLAAAIGTPLVAVFGPSDPRRWGPLSRNARTVQSKRDCRPCNRIRRPPAHCSRPMPECLSDISADQVLAAVENVLAENRAWIEGRQVQGEAADAGR